MQCGFLTPYPVGMFILENESIIVSGQKIVSLIDCPDHIKTSDQHYQLCKCSLTICVISSLWYHMYPGSLNITHWKWHLLSAPAIFTHNFAFFTCLLSVNNDVQDNSPPSVPFDHQDLKWNIITPAGVVSGPYRIDDLKCVTEVLPFYSQSLMVRKGGSRNAAIRIHDAVNQENTENVTTNVTKG